MKFKNRRDAGKKLALALEKYKGKEKVIILALPRGGIPLGREVADHLNAPLYLLFAHKIGHPSNPEYAIGAISEGGAVLLPRENIIDQRYLSEEKNRLLLVMRERRNYYQAPPVPPLAGTTVILVDDGLATGLTMQAAIQDLKHLHPKTLVVAVPVSPPDTANHIRRLVDELVILETPSFFLGSVGAYYDDFSQVEDEEIQSLLRPSSL